MPISEIHNSTTATTNSKLSPSPKPTDNTTLNWLAIGPVIAIVVLIGIFIGFVMFDKINRKRLLKRHATSESEERIIDSPVQVAVVQEVPQLPVYTAEAPPIRSFLLPPVYSPIPKPVGH